MSSILFYVLCLPLVCFFLIYYKPQQQQGNIIMSFLTQQSDPTDTTTTQSGTTLMQTLTMFGDSITQGAWHNGTGTALADVYQRKLDVLNRGFSGYNTVWAIPVAKEFLPKKNDQLPKIALMTIWFGANELSEFNSAKSFRIREIKPTIQLTFDLSSEVQLTSSAALPPSPQSIEIPEFKANLHAIINLLKDSKSPWYSPTTKFLLITPPPVNDFVRNAELASRTPARVPDRNSERTRAFAVAVIEVGIETGIPVVDCWTAITLAAQQVPEGLEKYLSDGLHLTTAGYQIVSEGVAATIFDRLPELHWDRLGQVFPHWADIVNENALQGILSKQKKDEESRIGQGSDDSSMVGKSEL